MKYILIGLIVLFLDQITKHLVFVTHNPYLWNNGGAWGWGNGWTGYALLPMLILLVGWWQRHFFWEQSGRLGKYGMALIIAGAVGNILDRFWWGQVLDWISVFSWFPWFNVADMAVTGGTGLFLLDHVQSGTKKQI